MREVWKFKLRLDDVQAVSMPAGARVVMVAEQYGALCLWAEVLPTNERTLRLFAVHGTGHAVSDGRVYVGSAVTAEGALVWHVYEVV